MHGQGVTHFTTVKVWFILLILPHEFRQGYRNVLGRHSGQANVEEWFDFEGSELLFSLQASSNPIS